MRSNSKKKHLTWTQNRSRGHAISHAESMMAWHTARSLNIGSWTATCIECKKKGKRKGKGKRGERDFFSLSLAKEAEGRGSDLSRLRPFALATFRACDLSRPSRRLSSGGAADVSRSLTIKARARRHQNAPPFNTDHSCRRHRVEIGVSRFKRSKSTAAAAHCARPKKKEMKNRNEQRRAFIDDEFFL